MYWQWKTVAESMIHIQMVCTRDGLYIYSMIRTHYENKIKTRMGERTHFGEGGGGENLQKWLNSRRTGSPLKVQKELSIFLNNIPRSFISQLLLK